MQPADLVRGYYSLFERASREVLDEVVHDDFELTDAPFAWTLRGKEAVWKTVDGAPQLEPGAFVCDRYFGDENAGAMHWSWDVRPEAAAIYRLPIGAGARVEGVALVTFRDGKLATLTEYWDSADLLRQLGVELPRARMG